MRSTTCGAGPSGGALHAFGRSKKAGWQSSCRMGARAQHPVRSAQSGSQTMNINIPIVVAFFIVIPPRWFKGPLPKPLNTPDRHRNGPVRKARAGRRAADGEDPSSSRSVFRMRRLPDRHGGRQHLLPGSGQAHATWAPVRRVRVPPAACAGQRARVADPVRDFNVFVNADNLRRMKSATTSERDATAQRRTPFPRQAAGYAFGQPALEV
jgi:hypothetical protein